MPYPHFNLKLFMLHFYFHSMPKQNYPQLSKIYALASCCLLLLLQLDYTKLNICFWSFLSLEIDQVTRIFIFNSLKIDSEHLYILQVFTHIYKQYCVYVLVPPVITSVCGCLSVCVIASQKID